MYILVFAAIMLWFEVASSTMSCGNSVLSSSFGFMYTIPGRLLFMVFSGVLVCSLESIFALIVGTLEITNAFFNSYVLVTHRTQTSEVFDCLLLSANNSLFF
jgi:hypothetical protein